MQEPILTFAEAYEGFRLNCITRNLRDATITHYDDTLRTIYKFIDANMEVKNIDKSVVNEFILGCKNELQIKDITLNTYLRGLRTILYYFMEKEYMETFHITLTKYDKDIIQTYSNTELKVLLKKPVMSKCNFMEYRNWVIVNFLLSVGCRCNSLVNIKIADVDFDNNVVYLNTTKSRKPLIIPLSSTINKVLKEYVKVRKGKNEDYLFCNAYGNKIKPQNLNANIRSYNRNRKIETTGLHRFRHTFAKNWILNGGDILKLQKLLGHSDLETVKIYVEMFTNDLQKDFDKYNPLENINKHQNMNLNMKRK